jgi:Polyketide synthase dehydratase N-terminal domain
VAECRLTAQRQLPGSEEPVLTTHFTGRVRLAAEPRAAEQAPITDRGGDAVVASEVYRLYFHGPAYQVVSSGWRSGDACAAQLAADLPPNQEPVEPGTVTVPRLAELCFQTAGLLEAGREGRLALPAHVGSASWFPTAAETADGPLVAAAWSVDGGFDAVVTDREGGVLLRLTGYGTVALPQPLEDEVRAPLQRVLGD